jgi:hypothetical protein
MMGEPAVKTHCQGRNFDKTFEFYPLWGNVRYYLTVYQNPYISGSSYWNFEIKPKPDSTTIYTISF